jgi:hypothetical protein
MLESRRGPLKDQRHPEAGTAVAPAERSEGSNVYEENKEETSSRTTHPSHSLLSKAIGPETPAQAAQRPCS